MNAGELLMIGEAAGQLAVSVSRLRRFLDRGPQPVRRLGKGKVRVIQIGDLPKIKAALASRDGAA